MFLRKFANRLDILLYMAIHRGGIRETPATNRIFRSWSALGLNIRLIPYSLVCRGGVLPVDVVLRKEPIPA